MFSSDDSLLTEKERAAVVCLDIWIQQNMELVDLMIFQCILLTIKDFLLQKDAFLSVNVGGMDY